TTDQDTDTVEHVVEPAAEHGPVALQAGDLAVHAVEHETQMEEHGAGQQPVPVRKEKAHRSGKTENECYDRQLVGGDGRFVRGPLDQPRSEWIDQTDRPPRVTRFICLFSYVVEGEMRHSRGSKHRAS